MTDTTASPKTPWLRYTVLALVGLQVALFAFAQLDYWLRAASMDMMTRSMGQDMSIIICIPLVLLTLPALILALKRRWLVLALILALLPLLLVVAFFGFFALR
ncbi:hypothetical protein [Devosia sp. CN2-171]|uniref:hypothetical protein n=1 Tax=Devosia sp. CN2-171 TaxID=3400909 RepID=UPI003BF8513F